MKITKLFVIQALLSIVLFGHAAFGQSTQFTYQGRLLDSALPPTANYDFEFSLWDSLVDGTQQGTTQTVTGVAVANGIFTVKLSFGAQFTGAARFIEIHVRVAGGGAYTTLAPRQPFTSAPYSIRSSNATAADKLSPACDLCVTDAMISDISGSKVTGTVANATNAVNATTAVTAGNVTGVVAIANGGTGSTTKNFVDLTTNQTAAGNKTFTGAVGVTGGSGVFNGNGSGLTNLSATNITSGTLNNARLGIVPIVNGGTGSATQNFVDLSENQGIFGDKAFFGTMRAVLIRLGNFFGSTELDSDKVSSPAFYSNGNRILSWGNGYSVSLGRNAGLSGSSFTYVGENAGLSNTIGTNNVFVGNDAGKSNVTGDANTFVGWRNGEANTGGAFNTFVGSFAGSSNIGGSANTFLGTNAGTANVMGSKNTLIGDNANVGSGALTNATAVGANAIVTTSNRVQLGRNTLDTVSIGALAAATAVQLCINGTVIAACSSSARYKEKVQPFRSGLNLVRRLNPVTYDWIERKEPDLGLIAEEVEKVEPLLVTYNHKGEIQGVKYDQITLALINAVKEQQSQIEAQQKLIDELKQIVCTLKPDAAICVVKETKP